MKNLKTALLIIASLLITVILYQENLFAKVKTETDPQPRVERVIYKPRESKKKYNFSAWAGVGFRFASEGLQNYVTKPMIDYQIGIEKSVWNINRYDFLYLALIFDFTYSSRFLGSNQFAFNYDAVYSLSNEQLLFGVEKTFGTPYVSGFLEAGPMLALPYFQILESVGNNAIDYSLRPAFGGSFNGGINFNIVPRNNVTYVFRLAMNLMLTTPQHNINSFNGENLNIHALTYAPVVSFGVRL